MASSTIITNNLRDERIVHMVVKSLCLHTFLSKHVLQVVVKMLTNLRLGVTIITNNIKDKRIVRMVVKLLCPHILLSKNIFIKEHACSCEFEDRGCNKA